MDTKRPPYRLLLASQIVGLIGLVACVVIWAITDAWWPGPLGIVFAAMALVPQIMGALSDPRE